MKKIVLITVFFVVLVIGITVYANYYKSNTSGEGITSRGTKVSPSVPQPKHIVIVVEENHSKEQIIGNAKAPYINKLAKDGALFTNSHGIQHPSQANYVALFSGDTQGIVNDDCPHTFNAANLSTELRKVNKTFTGYSEDLPFIGFKGCEHKSYRLKHNPWVNFSNVPEKENQPFTAFPSDFTQLPTVSFVVPNQQHDMHDGTIQEADKWLQNNIDKYVKWAYENDSLLILTWDEDDFKKANLIPTIFIGPMVKKGEYTDYINHYHVLRTMEDMYGLTPLGKTKGKSAIYNVWN